MSEDKKIKVVFHPDFFKNFDGTQEELDAIIKSLEESVDSDTVESRKLTDEEIDNLPDHILRELEQVLDMIGENGLDMDQIEADYKKNLN